MGQTVTNFDKAFKIKYWDRTEKGFGEAFFRSYVLLSRLEQREETLRGRHIEVPFHRSNTRTGGPRSEGAVLPVAGNQTTEVLKITPIHCYWPLKLSGPVIDQGNYEDAAFWKVVDFEVRNANKDMRNDLNMQLYADGSGILATVRVASGGASTTIAVDDTSWLQPDMPIVVATISTGVIVAAGVGTIVSIDHAARTIVFSTNPDTTTLMALYRPGGAVGEVALASTNSITGLDAAISASKAYGAITAGQRATAAYWWSQGNVFSGADGIDEGRMLFWEETIKNRGGGDISLIITAGEQWRSIGEALKINGMTALPMEKLKFGFNAIMWQSGRGRSIPIVSDPHCPRDRMFLLDESTLYLGQTKKLGFMNFDGQTWACPRSVDEYVAQLVWRGNLICTNPKGNGVVTGLPLATPAR